MTRISNTDQIMALLRHQLQRMEKSNQSGRTKPASKTRGNTASGAVTRLSALAHDESLPREAFERAFIRALLMDELGQALAEDHRFERIANDVHRLVKSDTQTRDLLVRAVKKIEDQGQK